MKTKLATLIFSAAFFMAATGTAHAAGDAAAGEEQAKTACAGCHGAAGEGSEDNPAIAGMEPDAFTDAVKAYQTGARPNPLKQALMSPLTDDEIANLAAYYASL